MADFFTKQYRVYYEDTDFSGVVYHSNYLKFCERARTDFVAEKLGFSQSKAYEDKVGFVVSRLNARFASSAVFEDQLSVTCIPYKVTGVSVFMYQTITNQDGVLLYEQACQIVSLKDKRPCALPAEFSQKVKELCCDPEQLNMHVQL